MISYQTAARWHACAQAGERKGKESTSSKGKGCSSLPSMYHSINCAILSEEGGAGATGAGKQIPEVVSLIFPPPKEKQ